MTALGHLPVMIAAGGAGTRMGGGKPLRLLGGRTLIDRALGYARTQGGPVAIAAADRDQVPDLGVSLLIDDSPGLGPISALASAMGFARAHDAAHVLLIGCDLPFLPADLAQRLSAAIGDAGAAVPVSDGRDQTLAALWHADPAALGAYLATGRRSPWGYAEAHGMARVPFADDGAFANLNDPAALAAAEARLVRG